ncbi:hypothetical protein SVIOM342S_06557 [Streptomyces violaceorubidus]
MPASCSPRAVVRPPMPAPAITIVTPASCSARSADAPRRRVSWAVARVRSVIWRSRSTLAPPLPTG